jgi:alanyl-tRNA synthetase
MASLEVDRERRMSLSAAHTGCHLVAYAFNEATDHLWSKDAPRDSRGSRNFDAAALIDSRHHLGGSIDRYRLGKSLRRRGFRHEQLMAELDVHVARANDILATWVAMKAEVSVVGDSDRFTGERMWRCEVHPAATMPCGGTHVSSLGELAAITISTTYLEDERELRLTAASELR